MGIFSSSKGRGGRNQGKGKAPPDTPEAQLLQMIRAARVSHVLLECLRSGNRAADPAKQELGKLKNHWTLRVVIRDEFSYRQGGVEKDARSIRLSVEVNQDSSLRIRWLDIKPMPINEGQASISGLAQFQFPLENPQIPVTVGKFIDIASVLFPFEYTVVAKSLVPNPMAKASRPDLVEHPNGCRDFTAQFFTLLHQQGLVKWQIVRHSPVTPPALVARVGTMFHEVIGFRYSRGSDNRLLIHENRIVEARFPPSFNRQRVVWVRLDPPEYEQNPQMAPPVPLSYNIELPYQTEIPERIPVFNQTADYLHRPAAGGSGGQSGSTTAQQSSGSGGRHGRGRR